MKLLAGRVDPAVVAASRAVIATLAIGAFFALIGRALTPGRGALTAWIVIGVFNGVVPNVLTAVAVERIPAGLAAMIQSSGPLIVACLAHVLFADERLTRRRAAGVAVGFLGMLVLIGPAASPASGVDVLGVLAMAGTTFSYAGTTLYIRSLADADPWPSVSSSSPG
jgi:drug/metabolite transporter (DMT)-like permease